MKFSKDQIAILKAYIKVSQRTGLHPTQTDLLNAGFSRDKVRGQFNTLENLRKHAKLYQPAAFADIVDEELFTPQAFKQLKDAAGEYKRFVVTTAVVGCDVHAGFMSAIKSYCRKNDAL